MIFPPQKVTYGSGVAVATFERINYVSENNGSEADNFPTAESNIRIRCRRRDRGVKGRRQPLVRL